MAFELINQRPHCFDQNDHVLAKAGRLCVGAHIEGRKSNVGIEQLTSARRFTQRSFRCVQTASPQGPVLGAPFLKQCTGESRQCLYLYYALIDRCCRFVKTR